MTKVDARSSSIKAWMITRCKRRNLPYKRLSLVSTILYVKPHSGTFDYLVRSVSLVSDMQTMPNRRASYHWWWRHEKISFLSLIFFDWTFCLRSKNKNSYKFFFFLSSDGTVWDFELSWVRIQYFLELNIVTTVNLDWYFPTANFSTSFFSPSLPPPPLINLFWSS